MKPRIFMDATMHILRILIFCVLAACQTAITVDGDSIPVEADEKASESAFDSLSSNRDNRSLQILNVSLVKSNRDGHKVDHWGDVIQFALLLSEDQQIYIFQGSETLKLPKYYKEVFDLEYFKRSYEHDVESRDGTQRGLGWQYYLSDSLLGRIQFAQGQGQLYFLSHKDFGRYKYSAVEFALGNQWSWRYFTLGLDWLVFRSPIAFEIGGKKVSPGDFSTLNYLIGNMSIGLAF